MSDHLRIDADLGRLAEVRRFVREEAEAVHATVECLDDLVQAIDEASTNVIVHGYRGRPGWLEIGIALEDEQFVVRIEDEAPSFDPTERARARPERPADVARGRAGWGSISCARRPMA